jgi:arylsulfatase A-like enzyme
VAGCATATVGKVIAALKTNGLDKNTVIIFMSDNGGLATSEGHPTSNLPLRAGKGWLYEGGIREPMIVHWPGVTKTGSVSDAAVISTDFYPTILEMAGLPSMPKQHIDGKSMVPILKGKAKRRGPVFWHYPHYGNQGGSPGSAVRSGDWKLIEFYEEGRQPELYDLRNDPGEQRNVYKQNSSKAMELKKALDAWRSEVHANLPTRNPNGVK